MSRQNPPIQATPELRLLAITRRHNMPPSVAALVAALCFGPERRDHHATLSSIVAQRGAGAAR